MRLKMFERKPIYREIAKDYQNARKKEKTKMLDNFLQLTGLKNRNYAARLLRLHGRKIRLNEKIYLKADITEKCKRPGRKKKYDEEVKKVLIKIWETSNYICGKRLKANIKEILKYD